MEDHEIVDAFIGDLSQYIPDYDGIMEPDIDGGWMRADQVESAILSVVAKYGLEKYLIQKEQGKE